jgi:hypothetical protein
MLHQFTSAVRASNNAGMMLKDIAAVEPSEKIAMRVLSLRILILNYFWLLDRRSLFVSPRLRRVVLMQITTKSTRTCCSQAPVRS